LTRFLSDIDSLFYVGVGVIIFFYVGVVIGRFKDERIDLDQHKWIIFTYIALMVLTIILWRYIFDMVLGPKILETISPKLDIEVK